MFLTAFYPSTTLPDSQLTMATAHTGKGKSVAVQELQTAFADIMSHEDTLKQKFRAKFNSIVGAKNKWRFLKGLSALTVGASEKMGTLAEVQTEILDQVTDVS